MWQKAATTWKSCSTSLCDTPDQKVTDFKHWQQAWSFDSHICVWECVSLDIWWSYFIHNFQTAYQTQQMQMLHTADGRPTRVRPVSDQIFYYQLFLPVLYLSLIFACAHLLCNKMVRQEVMRAGFALDWPRAGLACTRSWETWLKHWKEWEWGNVRRLVYVNTTAAKDAVLYRQMQSIRRHQHWLALSRKLCKVTLNLGSYFIFFFLRGLKEINL